MLGVVREGHGGDPRRTVAQLKRSLSSANVRMQIVEGDIGGFLLAVGDGGHDGDDGGLAVHDHGVDMFEFIASEDALALRLDVREHEVIARRIDNRVFIGEEQAGLELRSNTEDRLNLERNGRGDSCCCHVLAGEKKRTAISCVDAGKRPFCLMFTMT